MQALVETEVQGYSILHHAAIQKADQIVWKKFEEEGTTVTRLSDEDVTLMTGVAVPIWLKYAQRDAASQKILISSSTICSLDLWVM